MIWFTNLIEITSLAAIRRTYLRRKVFGWILMFNVFIIYYVVGGIHLILETKLEKE